MCIENCRCSRSDLHYILTISHKFIIATRHQIIQSDLLTGVYNLWSILSFERIREKILAVILINTNIRNSGIGCRSITQKIWIIQHKTVNQWIIFVCAWNLVDSISYFRKSYRNTAGINNIILHCLRNRTNHAFKSYSYCIQIFIILLISSRKLKSKLCSCIRRFQLIAEHNKLDLSLARHSLFET